MALSPNVVVVAPGDLITAVHLNNVRSNLDRLDTDKLSKSGGTMTGNINMGGGAFTIVGVPNPTGAGYVANKTYVDSTTVSQVTNSTMAGQLTIGGAPDAATPVAGILLLPVGQMNVVTPATATAGQANLALGRGGSPGGNTGAQYVRFDRGAAAIGSITIASATSVAYGTTSDPRAKTAPPLTRGIDTAAARVQAIGRNAWQGSHIDPGTGDPEGGDLWDFVSSHDIETHAPYAVYGERDAVDADGAPVFQQVSYGDLVPLLFAALADALDRIDALEAAA